MASRSSKWRHEQALQRAQRDADVNELADQVSTLVLGSNREPQPASQRSHRRQQGSTTPTSSSLPSPPSPSSSRDEMHPRHLRNMMIDVSAMYADLHQRRQSFNATGRRLTFLVSPLGSDPAIPRERLEIMGANSGPQQLHTSHPSNQEFLPYEIHLFSTIYLSQGLLDEGSIDLADASTLVDIIDCAWDEVMRLERIKCASWNEQRFPVLPSETDIDTEAFFAANYDTSTPASRLILACRILPLMLHLFFGVPRRPANLLLVGLRSIIELCSMLILPVDNHADPFREGSSAIWDGIPQDIRTVVSAFDLDPRIDSYICCPSCFALYGDDNGLDLCSHQETPQSGQCGTKLFRKRSNGGKFYLGPILTYHHQKMTFWLGRFLARAGVEDIADRVLTSYSSSCTVHDILFATALRNFRGPGDSSSFFFDNSNDPTSARLVFALAVDGFNPFRSKAGGQTVSSTGIYLVLLNLPPGMRFLAENMYLVGVIPGKPSLNQMNHSLRLLVDDLLLFWDPGVFFSRTANYPMGRRVYSAVIPVVADVLAARQVSGFGSHSMTFFCHCCYLTLDDMENFEPSTWPRRTSSDHRVVATAWRDAPNTAIREWIFEQYGVRWSELLRLPYWDPIKFTIIDSMHNHYLGLIRTHCREIWGMNIEAPEGEGESHPTQKEPPRPDPVKLAAANRLVRHGSDAELAKRTTKAVLWHLCHDRDLRRLGGTTGKMLKELKEWRRREGLPVPEDDLHARPTRTPRGAHQVETAEPVANTGTNNLTSRPARISLHSTSAPGSLPVSSGAGNRFDVQRVEDLPNLPDALKPRSGDVAHAITLFQRGQQLGPLTRLRRDILQYMCSFWGLSADGVKADLAARLIEHRDAVAESPSLSQDANLPVAFGPVESHIIPPLSQQPIHTIAPDAHLNDPILPLLEAEEISGPRNQPRNVRRSSPVRLVPHAELDPERRVSQAEGNRLRELYGLPEPPPRPRATGSRSQRTSRPHVLGRDTLPLIHEDVKLTQLPSWVSPAPVNFGTTARGKLSADQWRTVATVHLPITLIRLWGQEEGRKKQMLDNFLDLVSAINVGGMLETTEEHVRLYETLILRYLRNMKELYKEAAVKANHHLAIHIVEFLRLFGPIHAWRAFVFERFNYLLQNLNTNMKIGEMELTFMNQTCRAANFRALLRHGDVQAAVTKLIVMYDRIQSEDSRGTRLVDDLRLAKTVLDQDRACKDADDRDLVEVRSTGKGIILDDPAFYALLYHLNQRLRCDRYVDERCLKKRKDQEFLSRTVSPCPDIRLQGVRYKPEKHSHKDCNILVRSEAGGTFAAKLLDIFTHRRYTPGEDQPEDEPFLLVAPLQELSPEDARFDRYRDYEYAGGFLCYNRYLQPRIITAEELECHTAITPMFVGSIEQKCIHVLPLNRLLPSVTPLKRMDVEPATD